MAAETATQAEHVLFVTGPLREQLYEHFWRLFEGRDGVEVRIDRRFAERRRSRRAPVDGERRSQERRRRAPDWIVPPPGVA